MGWLIRAAALVFLLVFAGSWPGGAVAEEHGKPEKGGEAPKGDHGKPPEKGEHGKPPEKGDKGDKGDAKPGQLVSLGMYYDVPDLMVNLITTARKPVFLKLSLILQMGNEADRPKLDAIMPRLIDGFQTYLRQVHVEDLGGSMGMYRLREDLLLRASTLALPVEIKDVLFKEMLVR